MAENSFEAISAQWLNQPGLKNLKYAKALAIGATLPVIFVMYGWIFNIELLKSFLPNQMPMKFITAVSFFLSGLSIFFVAESVRGKREVAQIVLPATAISVLLLMATTVAGSLLKIETGIESLFVGALSKTTMVGASELPAIPEVAGFIAISIISIVALFRVRYLKRVTFYLGLIILVFGSMAILGFLVGNENLYFKFFSQGYPVVFSSGAIFVIIGLSLVVLGRVINNLSVYPYD